MEPSSLTDQDRESIMEFGRSQFRSVEFQNEMSQKFLQRKIILKNENHDS